MDRKAVSINILGLVVLGISGILINIIVAKYYSAATLGLFNQALAFYFILSQFAVGGVHFSVLQKISQQPAQSDFVAQVLRSGLAVVTALSAVIAALLWATSAWWAQFFASPDLALGLSFVAPSLVLFACNKVFMSALNGLGRMSTFAALQMLRGLCLAVSCFVMSQLEVNGKVLPSVLLITEVFVAVVAIVILREHLRAGCGEPFGRRMRDHFAFGMRGFASGALLELNTRVDLLVLGYYLSDEKVGIYSFAALLAEGFFQLLVVFRNFANPEIARLMARGEQDTLRRKISQFRPRIYAVVAAAALCTWGGFYVLEMLLYHGSFSESVTVLAFLLAGIWLSSGFTPFDGVLIQSGHPGWQSIYVFCNVATNFVFNVVAVPLWGLHGAAIATFAAFSLSPVFLVLLSNRVLQTRLFLGATPARAA